MKIIRGRSPPHLCCGKYLKCKGGAEKWGGWFEEKNWIGWQEHMKGLVSRLNTLLASPENAIELISPQEQKNDLAAEQADCSAVGNSWPNMEL